MTTTEIVITYLCSNIYFFYEHRFKNEALNICVNVFCCLKFSMWILEAVALSKERWNGTSLFLFSTYFSLSPSLYEFFYSSEKSLFLSHFPIFFLFSGNKRTQVSNYLVLLSLRFNVYPSSLELTHNVVYAYIYSRDIIQLIALLIGLIHSDEHSKKTNPQMLKKTEPCRIPLEKSKIHKNFIWFWIPMNGTKSQWFSFIIRNIFEGISLTKALVWLKAIKSSKVNGLSRTYS